MITLKNEIQTNVNDIRLGSVIRKEVNPKIYMVNNLPYLKKDIGWQIRNY